MAADYFPRYWYCSLLPGQVHRNAGGFNVAHFDGSVPCFDDAEGVTLDPANSEGSGFMDSARRTELSGQKLDHHDAPWPAKAYLY